MKKIILFLAILNLSSFSAFAKDGYYVGADYLNSKVKYKFVNKGAATSPANPKSEDKNTDGYSLNAGYKFELEKSFFVAPEIFYDNINSTANSYYLPQSSSRLQDNMEIKDRFGAKVNVGYNLNCKVNVFVNYGLARVRGTTHNYSQGNSKSSSDMASIYGLGIAYNLTDNWAAKILYDMQRGITLDGGAGASNKVKISTIKFGLAYSF